MSEQASSVSEYRLITCFLPVGRGKEVLDALRKQKGIHSAFVHHARGAGVDSGRSNKVPFYVEREIITVLTPKELADDIFEFVYFAAGINQPHAGMVLMEKALRGMPCTLPDLPDEV